MELDLRPLFRYRKVIFATFLMALLAILMSLLLPMPTDLSVRALGQAATATSPAPTETKVEVEPQATQVIATEPIQMGSEASQSGGEGADETIPCEHCEPEGAPVKGSSLFITCRFRDIFQPGHVGLDIAVPAYTEILATQDGEVTYAGFDPTYGNMVIVCNPYWETRYAHNAYLLVRPGDQVQQGDLLALSGNTGSSSGDHLHYEILDALENHRNPESFMEADEINLDFLDCPVETQPNTE